MRLAALMLAGLLLGGWSTVPSSPVVQGETNVVCRDQHTVQFDPGLTTEAARSNFSTTDGVIICHGQIDGHDVTGRQGRFTQAGVLVGDCSHGEIAGTLSITVPTAEGPARFTMAYEGNYMPGVGSKIGDQGGVVFEFYPSEGDCVTTTVEEITVVSVDRRFE